MSGENQQITMNSTKLVDQLHTQPIQVMLVDDEAIVRTGLQKILSEHAQIDVIAEASSGEEAETMLNLVKPDVVLMDISMPGQGGIETTKRALATYPDINVLALSVHCDEHYPSQILQAGAQGYITKGVGAEEMVEAIWQVFSGNQYICDAVAKKVRPRHLLGRDRLFECLDKDEKNVCSQLVMGDSIDKIADNLNLTFSETEQLRQQAFEKLNIDNEVALIHLAIRNGLLDKDNSYCN
ncbi:MAG: response regulator [Pseudomonadota bacterium]|nr:response regulator [Pseudomonadota bacterium]